MITTKIKCLFVVNNFGYRISKSSRISIIRIIFVKVLRVRTQKSKCERITNALLILFEVEINRLGRQTLNG
jgi:hypothetical protein